MKHTHRILSILTVSGALLAGAAGCDQGFEPGSDAGDDVGEERVAVNADRHRGPAGGHRLEALGLDESQREQAKALRAEMERDLEPIMEQLREKEAQLRTLWAAESPDRAAILELGSQIDALRRSMRDRQAQLRSATSELLTDEQRARLAVRGPRGEHGRRGPRGERGDDEQGRAPGDGDGPRHGRGLRGHGPGGPGGMPGFGPGLAHRLGLDDAQQAQVQAIVDRAREAGAPAREQMRELREQERALRSAGQVDERALGALHDRIDALMSAERERQVDVRLAIIGLLTPEQRALFAELSPRAERGQRGAGMDGHRGPRGAGMDGHRGPRGAGMDGHRGPRGAGMDGRRGPRGAGMDGHRGPRGAGMDGRRGPRGAGMDGQRGPRGAGMLERPRLE